MLCTLRISKACYETYNKVQIPSLLEYIVFLALPIPTIMMLMSQIALDNWIATCCPWCAPFLNVMPEKKEVRNGDV